MNSGLARVSRHLTAPEPPKAPAGVHADLSLPGPRSWPDQDVAGVVWTLVRTDFKVRYHGSLGGVAWALARPLAMFGVLVAVFSLIFGQEPNYLLGLVIGLFLYEFFSEGTMAGLRSLLQKGYLLTKTRFPLWIVVATSSVHAIVALSVFTVSILVYLAFEGLFPTPLRLGLFFAYVVQMWLIVVGCSLATSPLFLRFRDLDHLWGTVSQVGFFVAPIVFPLAAIPPHAQPYLFLWPPTPVVVYAKQVLVDGTVPSLGANLYLLGVTAVTLGLGCLIFARYARNAAEHL